MKNTASIQENSAMELRTRGMYGSTVNGVERSFESRPRRARIKAQAQAKIHPGEAGVVSGRRIRVEMPPALGKLLTLRGILLMLASTLSVGTAVILMLFNFETAVIYGNTKYSQEQIESFITRDFLGENTFVMALKYHHRKVSGIPFVDRIDIDIINPSTVRVNITEKPTDGCIFYKGRNVYFSRDGMIQTVSGRTVEETTVVNGVVLTHSKMGARILAKNQLGLDLALELMRAAYKYGIRADSIDVDSRNNLTATFGDVMVRVGKTGYDQKMFRLHQIYPYLEGRSGVISMTGYKDTYDSNYNIVLSPFVTEAELRAAEEEAEAEKAEAEAAAEAEKAEAETAESEKKDAEKEGAAETAPAAPAAAAATPEAGTAAQTPAAEAELNGTAPAAAPDPAAQDAARPAEAEAPQQQEAAQVTEAEAPQQETAQTAEAEAPQAAEAGAPEAPVQETQQAAQTEAPQQETAQQAAAEQSP